MTSTATQPSERRRAQALVEFLRSGRGETLCADVESATGASHALVEDVFQEACLHASSTGACRGQSAGEVYTWLRTATHWRVLSQLRRGPQRFELPVDGPVGQRDGSGPSAGADVEVIARERRGELCHLMELALSDLNERQRKVAVMHAYGVKGPEIAKQLRISRRQVQRLKEQMLTRARGALAAHAGSGCDDGDALVRRLAFGLANAREHADADLHMASCESCAGVYRRLQLWHANVAALAPMPAAAADPGMVERAVHKSAHALSHLKQQFADAGVQAKHHVAAGYARAVDVTPIAGARPGAAATVLASCLALGGGAATYCIDRGVDPVNGLVDVIQPGPANSPAEEHAEQPAPTPPPPATDLTTTPSAPPPAVEQQPAVDPVAAPPAQPPPPPPPEPTPPAVQFGEPATPAATSVPSTQTPTTSTPTPVPKSGGTDLYGP